MSQVTCVRGTGTKHCVRVSAVTRGNVRRGEREATVCRSVIRPPGSRPAGRPRLSFVSVQLYPPQPPLAPHALATPPPAHPPPPPTPRQRPSPRALY
ncbi:hypothetical protein RR48_03031 [Papilio machaon]|uniref:Uncharacterized protein n=1 Tax=Papilio machaon TaxID=76193 RepID=A0A0N1IE74_PAPMA|nr:hypothetical protein RR48_03031 [Papilio machaon]